MDELHIRFPHLTEKIFSRLDFQSLCTCREVSRTWNKAMETEKLSYVNKIKDYTKCSDELLAEMLNNFKSPIILVSIMNKIFSNFPKGTNQSHKYLKIWGNTPLHMAARIGQLAVYNLIMDNVVDKNPLAKNLSPLKNLKVKEPYQLRSASESTEYTPLHLAAISGQVSICKLIIKAFS